jgi:hypothetical protein
MKPYFVVESVAATLLLLVLSASPGRAQYHHHASMAAQLRVQMQLHREALKQQRALEKMQQLAAKHQAALEKQMVRAQQHAIRQELALQKRLARAHAPKSMRKSHPLLSHAVVRGATVHRSLASTKLDSVPLRRIHHKPPASREKPPHFPVSKLLPRSGTTLGQMYAMRFPNTTYPMTVPLTPMPVGSQPLGPQVSDLPTAGGVNQRAPAKPAQPIARPAENAVAETEPLPEMHKTRPSISATPKQKRDDSAPKREDSTPLICDIIEPPSERRVRLDANRNAAMQLVSVIAQGKTRATRTSTPIMEPNLVRQTPPLPVLPIKYTVAPLSFVD